MILSVRPAGPRATARWRPRATLRRLVRSGPGSSPGASRAGRAVTLAGIVRWLRTLIASLRTVIDLIAATTTTGLKVYARLDSNTYPTKIKVTDEQIQAVQLTGEEFHPEWNYQINPSVIKT